MRLSRLLVCLIFAVSLGAAPACGVSELDLHTSNDGGDAPTGAGVGSDAAAPDLAGDAGPACGPCGAGEVCAAQGDGGAVGCAPEWARAQTISLEDEQPNVQFGLGVARYGDTMFVTAPGEIADDAPCGAVYVFEWTSPNWRRTQRFAAPCGTSEGYVTQIAAGDGVLFLGRDDENTIYAFQKKDGYWTETAKLDVPAGAADFAAADGMLAVAGRDGVRVYAWTNGAFVLRSTLPSATLPTQTVMTPQFVAFYTVSALEDQVFVASRDGDGFAPPRLVATYKGVALFLSADGARFAVGEHVGKEVTASGSIDVFERRGDTYSRSTLDWKGCGSFRYAQVALHGDTLFARIEGCTDTFHEFRATASGWNEIAVDLSGPDPGGGPVLASDEGVFLCTDPMLNGDFGEVAAWNAGMSTTILTAGEGLSKPARGALGGELAFSGDVALLRGVGPLVYVFERRQGAFRQKTALPLSRSDPDAMAVSGDTIALLEGSRLRLYDRGADGEWRAGQALDPEPTDEPGQDYAFGRGGIAIEGDLLAVGQGLSTVSIYARHQGTWARERAVTFPYENDTYDRGSIRIAGGRILVVTLGGMVVLERGADGWSSDQLPRVPGVIAFDGARIAVVPYDGKGAMTDVVQIFDRQGTQWVKTAELPGSGIGARPSGWGAPVGLAISGDTLLASHFAESGNAVTSWRRAQDNTWHKGNSIVATGLAGQADFGASIAISGSTVLIGAPGADVGPAFQAGLVLAFEHQGDAPAPAK